MQLVKQHRIDRHDPRWATIDAATFAGNNLYNTVLDLTRQAYIKDHTVLGYGELDRLLQPIGEYRALPAKVAQWVLNQVRLAWTNCFASCQAWEAHPEKFLAHPKLPQYHDKQGRNLLTSSSQASSQHPKNRGWIVPSSLAVRVATVQPFEASAQVRIVPHATHSTVEVIYERAIRRANLHAQWVAA